VELPAEERKVFSVLFCDLVGFMAAAGAAADREDVQTWLVPYHNGDRAKPLVARAARPRCRRRPVRRPPAALTPRISSR
jgi:hypothetical protein